MGAGSAGLKFYVFLMLFLSFCFSSAALDRARAGGPARKAALGCPRITLPDATCPVDLYAEGFAAALVLREKRNSINAFFGAMPHDMRSDMPFFSASLSDHPIYFSVDGGPASGLTYFFDRENVLQFIPHAALNEGERNIDNGAQGAESLYSLENTAAAEIVFSRKITDKFCGGAVVRAAFCRDETRSDSDEYLESGGYWYDVTRKTSEKILYSKAEYAISAAFTPDENSCAAVSFGALKDLSAQYEPFITGLRKEGFKGAMPVYSALFSGYSSVRSADETQASSVWESGLSVDEKTGVSGFDLSAGCGARGRGLSVFTVSAGMTFGIEGDYSAVSSAAVDMYYGGDTEWSSSGKWTKIRRGSAHNVSLKGRYDLGGVAAAAAFKYRSAAADITEEEGEGPYTAVSSQVIDAAVGVLFLPDRFTVPLELFLESRSQSEDGGPNDRHADYSVFSAGVASGVEYDAGGGIFVRMGLDAAYGGTSCYVKQGEEVYSELAGTHLNPAFIQGAMSFGAGHVSDNFDVGLSLRYIRTGRLPAEEGTRHDESAMALLTDIKLFF